MAKPDEPKQEDWRITFDQVIDDMELADPNMLIGHTYTEFSNYALWAAKDLMELVFRHKVQRATGQRTN